MKRLPDLQKSFTSYNNRKENPQKLTQLSSRSHPRHLVEKKTAQKDTIIDITSDSQVNSNFPYGMRPQLILLYSLIIRSSMKLFSQRSRQCLLSFFQVFEA